jgi:hypothetical protein
LTILKFNLIWLLVSTSALVLWGGSVCLAEKALDANNGIENLYLPPNPDAQNDNQRWRLQKVGDFRLIIPAVGDNLR